ncbi:MAG TPA: C40 family peptidase [Burkholderiales bacterium]|nr:C40 family peptidase [Burkholderiales bacterium]
MNRAFAASALIFLAACASEPTSRPYSASSRSEVSASVADRAAAQATTMRGRPYHFGGDSISAGFDCSGLVKYSYRQVGVDLPHSTEQLRRLSRPVRVSGLRRGDLLFFDLEGKKSSHVGIYLGNGRFIHAPSTGKSVRSDRLDSPYWKKHLSEARRVTA